MKLLAYYSPSDLLLIFIGWLAVCLLVGIYLFLIGARNERDYRAKEFSERAAEDRINGNAGKANAGVERQACGDSGVA